MASMSWVKDQKRWRVRWRATNRRTHEVFSGSRVFEDKPTAARCWAEMEAKEKLWRRGVTEVASLPLSEDDRPTVEDARLLTPEMVADLLGVQMHILTLWRDRQQGPKYWLMGSRIRYKLADLLEWEKRTLVAVDPTASSSDK